MRRCAIRRGAFDTIAAIAVAIAFLMPLQSVRAPSPNTPEAAVLETMRAIHTAQTQYYSEFHRYARSLKELGPSTLGMPSGEAAADLEDREIASGIQSGYNFVIRGEGAHYTIQATPISFHAGSRSFYSDQTMEVHEHKGPERVTSLDPVMGGPGSW